MSARDTLPGRGRYIQLTGAMQYSSALKYIHGTVRPICSVP